jgi:hypothetical protein
VPLSPIIPRGQRSNDSNIADSIELYHGLDPTASWNAQFYNPGGSSNAVSKGALRTEELSTRTDLTVIRAQYPNWKFAAFSVADARKAGYILMRDPSDSTHVLLYDKNDPDRRASSSIAQKLANASRIV